MAVSFRVPGQRAKSVVTISEFLGVDFTNHPTNVDLRRSPWAPNMIRDVPGKVRKALGYEKIRQYDGGINGVFYRKGDETPLVHAGEALYAGEKKLYEGAANARSRAWEFGGKLYLVDGKRYLVYDGESVRPVSEVAYVPVVSIANSPAGCDGRQYEGLNLIQPKFTERFLGTAGTKQYQLSYAPLDAAAVTARVLTGEGAWAEKKEGVDFTVARQDGAGDLFGCAGGEPADRGGQCEHYRGKERAGVCRPHRLL